MAGSANQTYPFGVGNGRETIGCSESAIAKPFTMVLLDTFAQLVVHGFSSSRSGTALSFF